MYMKDLFIAEATIQKQNVNERHLLGHYSHLDCSTGYREKRSHNRMIDSRWALKQALKIHLTPLIKVKFQSSVYYRFTFTYFDIGLLM